MRKFSIKRLTILIISLSLMLINVNASAFTRDFVYDFIHHIPGKVYSGDLSTIKIKLKVSKWGSDKFLIKQVKNAMFSNEVLDTKHLKKVNGNNQNRNFQNHGACRYEFWKKQDGKQITGTGNITW